MLSAGGPAFLLQPVTVHFTVRSALTHEEEPQYARREGCGMIAIEFFQIDA